MTISLFLSYMSATIIQMQLSGFLIFLAGYMYVSSKMSEEMTA